MRREKRRGNEEKFSISLWINNTDSYMISCKLSSKWK